MDSHLVKGCIDRPPPSRAAPTAVEQSKPRSAKSAKDEDSTPPAHPANTTLMVPARLLWTVDRSILLLIVN
eukprot:m.206530 g.206530  ORF g.206530 m.206530 type:complete len:71 (+) comp25354_c0_seq2:984-1196(+)